jgi:hypothetical protein
MAAVCWGQSLSEPRLRVSDYFGAPGGIDYLNPYDLGPHRYHKSRDEKVGMVYTQKAGFFDIGHVREAADRTRYAVDVLYHHLMRSNRRFKFRMIEPSEYTVTVRYPVNWNQLDATAKQDIARTISIGYGQYLAHQSLVWHELLTWFGYASSGIFSEHISSFSWEDPYSDVVGTWLAAEAIRRGGDYDDQITRLLTEKLRELKAEPASMGKKAEDLIKGTWYSGGGYFFVKMQKRNFDVGYDDGQITPWLVPGLYPGATPQPCPVPDTRCLDDYDFQIDVQLDPNAAEKSKIYTALGLDANHDHMRLDVHFPELLEFIKSQAQAADGMDVDKPTL